MAAKPRPRNQPRHPADPAPEEQLANKVAVATASGLTLLSRLPKGVLPAVVGVGLVVGLIAGGILGLVVLALLAGLMGWLLAAFWPVLPPAGRLVRAVALVAVVIVGILNV